MFITHLLNCLTQVEYEGAILAIKDKLRKEEIDLSEIEQILEDKYQSMKHMLGVGMKRKTTMPYLQVTLCTRSHLRDGALTVESMDIKQLIVPKRKTITTRAQKENLCRKTNTVLK